MLGKFAAMLRTQKEIAELTGGLQIQPEEKDVVFARAVAACAAPCDC